MNADFLDVQRAEVEAARIYCVTRNHDRVLHFMSNKSNVLDGVWQGGAPSSRDDWLEFEALEGHTALQWAENLGHIECVSAFTDHLTALAAARRAAPEAGAAAQSSAAAAPADEKERRECYVCRAARRHRWGNKKTCAACHKVRYCGRACQRADWPFHRVECSARIG